MSKFAERYGPWAVVTGASAGIGTEYALRIAERGVNVVLVARRRDRLEQLASTIEDMYRVQARVAPADLTTRDVVQVLGRAPLSGKQQMHLVRFGGKLLLLSVTPSGAETLEVRTGVPQAMASRGGRPNPS